MTPRVKRGLLVLAPQWELCRALFFVQVRAGCDILSSLFPGIFLPFPRIFLECVQSSPNPPKLTQIDVQFKIPCPANSFVIFRSEKIKDKMFPGGTKQSEISRSAAGLLQHGVVIRRLWLDRNLLLTFTSAANRVTQLCIKTGSQDVSGVWLLPDSECERSTWLFGWPAPSQPSCWYIPDSGLDVQDSANGYTFDPVYGYIQGPAYGYLPQPNYPYNQTSGYPAD
ncbi:hypothetical protein C8J56DRAFT_893785 [Mycena floridula]|nr:hypothetical protein C8J56DRAFT_893785 [Mycena floridula]